MNNRKIKGKSGPDMVETQFGRVDTTNPDTLDGESLATVQRALRSTVDQWGKVVAEAERNPACARIAKSKRGTTGRRGHRLP